MDNGWGSASFKVAIVIIAFFVLIGTDSLIAFALTLIGLGIYFIPTMVAMDKNHPNRTVIFIVNLVFGLTFFGWVIALIMAYWNSDAKAHS